MLGYKYSMEKLWERFYYSLEDEDSLRGMRRLVNNAETMASYFEANGILTEARHTLSSIKIRKKKIDLSLHDRSIDNILVYVFLKSLTTLPVRTKAYKLGLIDQNGKLIREPKTQIENDSISNLDLLMFKIREWLRPKMIYLSSVNWLNGIYNNQRIQNYLLNSEIVSKQYIVRKINNELENILRKH